MTMTAYLSANLEQFSGLSCEAVTAVIKASTGVAVKRAAALDAAPAMEDFLCRCVNFSF